jgi:two-component system, chemotaxis family, chemotaxis protein CheY
MAHILLVEDSPAMLETLSLAMRSKGHYVVAASDGEQALESLNANHFDLVVTDIIMPALDGLGLIDAIREVTPSIKILAISGGGTATFVDFLDVARKRGAVATLEKPFPMSDFYNVLDRCLQE